MHERPAILVRRRRVHDDQRRRVGRVAPRRCQLRAEIAAEARVGRREREREVGQSYDVAQPIGELFRASVGGGVRRDQGSGSNDEVRLNVSASTTRSPTAMRTTNDVPG
jgi:hypothetical protein